MTDEPRGADDFIPPLTMDFFVCPRCGGYKWISYLQFVPDDGREWTYEFHCAKCDKMMGLTLKEVKEVRE